VRRLRHPSTALETGRKRNKEREGLESRRASLKVSESLSTGDLPRDLSIGGLANRENEVVGDDSGAVLLRL
jgi:hypothetical protein